MTLKNKTFFYLFSRRCNMWSCPIIGCERESSSLECLSIYKICIHNRIAIFFFVYIKDDAHFILKFRTRLQEENIGNLSNYLVSHFPSPEPVRCSMFRKNNNNKVKLSSILWCKNIHQKDVECRERKPLLFQLYCSPSWLMQRDFIPFLQ